MDRNTDFWTNLGQFAQTMRGENEQPQRKLHETLDAFRSMLPEEQFASKANLDFVLGELSALRPLVRMLVASGTTGR